MLVIGRGAWHGCGLALFVGYGLVQSTKFSLALLCGQVDILQHLGASLNVAYCYGAYEQPQCVGVVMELLSGGELWSRIRKGHYSEAGALGCQCH